MSRIVVVCCAMALLGVPSEASRTALHLRAIEGLALAVEAKDNLNTRGHLRRVRVYALGIGKALGLGPTELEALQAVHAPILNLRTVLKAALIACHGLRQLNGIVSRAQRARAVAA